MFAIVRRAVALALVLAFANAAAAPNKPPTVSITAPANGAVFSAPANITISVNASDQNGTVTKVDFYAGAMLLGTRTTAPYSVTWSNVTAGTYALTAQATDNLGATKTSTAVSITVTGPKVVIASPPSGATVYGGSVTLDGTFAGDPNATVLIDNGNTSRLATINGNHVVRLEETERREILTALERTNWHQGKTANLLGISPSTLYRRLRDYKITKRMMRAQKALP